jgi:hypothetical protein
MVDAEQMIELTAVDEDKLQPASTFAPPGCTEQLLPTIHIDPATVPAHRVLKHKPAVVAGLSLPETERLAPSRPPAILARHKVPHLLAVAALELLTDVLHLEVVAGLLALRAGYVNHLLPALPTIVLIALSDNLGWLPVEEAPTGARHQLEAPPAVRALGGLPHLVQIDLLEDEGLAVLIRALEVVALKPALLANHRESPFRFVDYHRVIDHAAVLALLDGPEYVPAVLKTNVGHEHLPSFKTLLWFSFALWAFW